MGGCPFARRSTSTRGAFVGRGMQSVLAAWARHVPWEIYTDSSSAKAIALRRSSGRSTRHIQTRYLSTRHIQTRYLWVQERVAAKQLRVLKVPTKSTPAHALTKSDKVCQSSACVPFAPFWSSVGLLWGPRGVVT
eukprot:4663923-Amphidinium_carterae.1